MTSLERMRVEKDGRLNTSHALLADIWNGTTPLENDQAISILGIYWEEIKPCLCMHVARKRKRGDVDMAMNTSCVHNSEMETAQTSFSRWASKQALLDE